MYQIDNEEVPTVEHRELSPVLYNDLFEKRIWKRMGTYVCVYRHLSLIHFGVHSKPTQHYKPMILKKNIEYWLIDQLLSKSRSLTLKNITQKSLREQERLRTRPEAKLSLYRCSKGQKSKTEAAEVFTADGWHGQMSKERDSPEVPRGHVTAEDRSSHSGDAPKEGPMIKACLPADSAPRSSPVLLLLKAGSSHTFETCTPAGSDVSLWMNTYLELY